jgi:hypothetical protein
MLFNIFKDKEVQKRIIEWINNQPDFSASEFKIRDNQVQIFSIYEHEHYSRRFCIIFSDEPDRIFFNKEISAKQRYDFKNFIYRFTRDGKLEQLKHL